MTRHRFGRYKYRFGMWLVRLGRGLTPVSEPIWETRIYRQNDPLFRNYPYSGSTAAFVAACFSANVEVDRLALSQSNNGRVLVRTLGTRFTREQVVRITNYKTPGVLVEFEDAGEVYDRCRYEDLMETAV